MKVQTLTQVWSPDLCQCLNAFFNAFKMHHQTLVMHFKSKFCRFLFKYGHFKLNFMTKKNRQSITHSKKGFGLLCFLLSTWSPIRIWWCMARCNYTTESEEITCL
jgi:hypothetical protein